MSDSDTYEGDGEGIDPEEGWYAEAQRQEHEDAVAACFHHQFTTA